MNQTKVIRLAIFASGNGTNAEALIRHFQNQERISVAVVLTNNPEAMVLQRSKRLNTPTRIFNRIQFRESGEVLAWLKEAGVTHIVLAGFLWLVPQSLIKAYPGKIINIHPSLLPKHGGKGMYGSHVHQAVKNSGDPVTGITIHMVNEQFDTGKILFQASCSVQVTDTPETIAGKVHQLEQAHFPAVIEKWLSEALTP